MPRRSKKKPKPQGAPEGAPHIHGKSGISGIPGGIPKIPQGVPEIPHMKVPGGIPGGVPHSKVLSLAGIDIHSSKTKSKISAEDHKKRKAARAEAFISKKKGTSTDTNPLHQSKRAQKRAAAAASLAAKQAGTTNLTKNPAAEAALKAEQSTPGPLHTRVPVSVKTQSAVGEQLHLHKAVAALTPHTPNAASPHARKPGLTLEGTHKESSTTDTKKPNTPKTPKAQRRAARRAAKEAGLAANKTANNLSRAADAAKIASVALTPHTPHSQHSPRPLSFVSGKAGIHNHTANATGTPKDLSTYVKRRAAGTTPINTPHAQKPVLTLSGTHKESSTSNPIKSKKKGQLSHENHLAARAAKSKKKSNKENAKLTKEQSIINTAQKTSPSSITSVEKAVPVPVKIESAVEEVHQKHQIEAKLVASSNKAPTEGAQKTANSIVHSKQSNTAPAYVSRSNRKKIAKEDAAKATAEQKAAKNITNSAPKGSNGTTSSYVSRSNRKKIAKDKAIAEQASATKATEDAAKATEDASKATAAEAVIVKSSTINPDKMTTDKHAAVATAKEALEQAKTDTYGTNKAGQEFKQKTLNNLSASVAAAEKDLSSHTAILKTMQNAEAKVAAETKPESVETLPKPESAEAAEAPKPESTEAPKPEDAAPKTEEAANKPESATSSINHFTSTHKSNTNKIPAQYTSRAERRQPRRRSKREKYVRTRNKNIGQQTGQSTPRKLSFLNKTFGVFGRKDFASNIRRENKKQKAVEEQQKTQNSQEQHQGQGQQEHWQRQPQQSQEQHQQNRLQHQHEDIQAAKLPADTGTPEKSIAGTGEAQKNVSSAEPAKEIRSILGLKTLTAEEVAAQGPRKVAAPNNTHSIRTQNPVKPENAEKTTPKPLTAEEVAPQGSRKVAEPNNTHSTRTQNPVKPENAIKNTPKAKTPEEIAAKKTENNANNKVGENISKMFNNKPENAEKSKPSKEHAELMASYNKKSAEHHNLMASYKQTSNKSNAYNKAKKSIEQRLLTETNNKKRKSLENQLIAKRKAYYNSNNNTKKNII